MSGCGEMTRKRMREQAEAISAGFALAKDNEKLEAETQRLQAEVERLQEKDARWQNEMDAANKKVLRMHQQSKASEACLSEIRAAADEWEKEGPCEEWAGLNDAAQQLRKILEKYDGLE